MQESSDVLLRHQEGQVLVATMNRPERMNALGGGLPQALNEAWLDFRDDPDLKVMIITGAGDRAFCAGMDLRQSDERARDLGAQSAQALLDADRSRSIRPSFNGNNFGLWKPVIAAINGWCLAAGCEMAMGCDTSESWRNTPRLASPKSSAAWEPSRPPTSSTSWPT